jgi:hypothetical protein
MEREKSKGFGGLIRGPTEVLGIEESEDVKENLKLVSAHLKISRGGLTELWKKVGVRKVLKYSRKENLELVLPYTDTPGDLIKAL